MRKIYLYATPSILEKEAELKPKDFHSLYHRCDVIDAGPDRMMGVRNISMGPSL